MPATRTTPKFLAMAAGVLLLCVAARPAQASDTDLYHKTLKSTGWLVAPSGDGTCWVLDREQRLVVTNKHVVGDADEVTVRFPTYKDGALVTAAAEYLRAQDAAIRGKVLYRDPVRDLALVQLDSLPEHVVALPLAAESAGKDAAVLSVGNSDPNASTLDKVTLWRMRTGKATGKLFRSARYLSGQQVDASVLKSNLNIRPGDSGGPIVNEQGELIAVSAYYQGDDSFGIDVSEVRAFLEQARQQ
jgi:S1-C subfamily serine protease